MASENSDRIGHSVLIVYASAAGSTALIAEFMAQRMRDRHILVRVEPVDRAPDPGLFEAAVLGSAIHDGEFPWRPGSMTSPTGSTKRCPPPDCRYRIARVNNGCRAAIPGCQRIDE